MDLVLIDHKDDLALDAFDELVEEAGEDFGVVAPLVKRNSPCALTALSMFSPKRAPRVLFATRGSRPALPTEPY